MRGITPGKESRSDNSNRRSRWLWLALCGGLILLLLALLYPRRAGEPETGNESVEDSDSSKARISAGAGRMQVSSRTGTLLPKPVANAPEVVAAKLGLFAERRREVARAMARHFKTEVPAEVEKFFDAAASGRWEETEALIRSLRTSRTQPDGKAVEALWPAIQDAYGAAELAHEWPSQKLLDYGQSILGSLQPGTVYVGGTDAGHFIPALLSETDQGAQHVVLTQNSLADQTYVNYAGFLYGDRLTALTSDDSQNAFKDYIADAQKRLQHDQQFPNEPRQIRPGEDIQVIDGRVSVTGQVAVMGINEQLLQTLMRKNPDAAFAIEESSSMPGLYAGTVPVGPIMEIRPQDGTDNFTAATAAQSVDYWRATAERLLGDPDASSSAAILKAYSHNATSQANLLAAHNYAVEAEQAYRLSSQLSPANPEPIEAFAGFLNRSGRADEARQLLDEFVRKNPDQNSVMEKVRASLRGGKQAPRP